MGFKSVYRCLQDVFPQVDARILKAVSIEHSKDPDEAVNAILTEVLPFLTKQSETPIYHHRGESSRVVYEEHNMPTSSHQAFEVAGEGSSSAPRSLAGENAENRNGHSGAFHADLIHLDETVNESEVSNLSDANDCNNQSDENSANEELILLGSTHETKNELPHVDAHDVSNALTKQDIDFHEQVRGDSESEVLIQCNKSNVEVEPEETLTSSVYGKDGSKCSLNDPLSESKDFDDSVDNEFDLVTRGRSCRKNLLQDASSLEAEKLDELVLPSVQVQTADAPACDFQSALCSGKDSFDIMHNNDWSVPELNNLEDELTRNDLVTRSGQICRIEILDEVIEDAKKNKTTLFSAMESVIRMMKEVELQEKAAEDAKQEAARGGLDTLIKVEELKQMLAHAKEANNMHAGEVYGEKAILATEVRELQSRLLSLSDERDKSLATLDEMRQTVEARLAAAEEERKAAEQEKLEKEESAQKLLSEQEAIMEKVVQESRLLEQEAEENSKLQEFLINRGRIVDMLQGEISVICQDVILLKKKFDERVPLSMSVSSSQTSCILASSGSSTKSMVADLVPELVEPFRNLENGSPIPSSSEAVESSKNPETKSPIHSSNESSPKSAAEKDRLKADHKSLLEDGWDIFDKDAELED
ncbi:hypothetical protein UlMin_031387 [Ulmus minor]